MAHSGHLLSINGYISPEDRNLVQYVPTPQDAAELLIKGAFFSYARKFTNKNTPLSKTISFPPKGQTREKDSGRIQGELYEL